MTNRQREIISYLFWGVVSMIVNIVVYHLGYEILHMSNIESTLIAWFTAVLVAYTSNKLFVFQSTGQNSLIEAGKFLLSRVCTGIMDVGIMWFMVDCLAQPALIWKVVSNILVVVLNYIFSKYLIFITHKT